MNRLSSRFWAPLLAVALACLPWTVSAQCGLVAHTTAQTTVHNEVPTLSTRAGWRLGDVIATLPAGAEIRVCQARKVGQFGIGTRTWLRIQFDGGISGWIFIGATDMTVARRAPQPGFVLISQAVAAENGASRGVGDGLPGSGRSWILLLAVAFVVLGIAAKLVYDHAALRPAQCTRALLVAPAATAALLLVGDFTLNGEAATLMCLLIAFQGGFFWQTLLRRPPSPQPLSRQRERGF